MHDLYSYTECWFAINPFRALLECKFLCVGALCAGILKKQNKQHNRMTWLISDCSNIIEGWIFYDFTEKCILKNEVY